MKKILFLTLIIITFLSCKDNDTVHLDVDTETLYFTVNEETQSIYISSTFEVKVVDQPEWVIIIPSEGTGNFTMEITVEQNTTGVQREGNVIISGFDSSRDTDVKMINVEVIQTAS